MRDIDNVRSVAANGRVRGVVVAVDVVEIMKTVHGPDSPTKESAGLRVLMPSLKRPNQIHGIHAPIKRGHNNDVLFGG